ncbi:MAG: cadmium-translocating P-type ATPase [Phycisphaerae bacterium]|nr:cadmium-translocating P-type ATPase [Phycisphaerae bacterium]
MSPSAASPPERTLRIDGMECAGCVAGVQSALSALPGIREAHVDLASGRAIVAASDSDEALVAAVRSRGFEARVLADPRRSRTEAEERQRARERGWKRRAIVGIALWVPLEILHWATHGSHALHGNLAVDLTLLLGGTIAVVVSGSGFFASAWRAARFRTTNMDTLVSVGVLAAYGLSVATFVAQRLGRMEGQPLWFAEAAALLGIISLGHWLEARATAKASATTRELLALQPEDAELLGSDGTTTRLESRLVRRGQCVLVRPGGRIPIDGTIRAGRAAVDESAVTGEPLPVARGTGDTVHAGTIATDGAIEVVAATDGDATSLTRIAEIVERAQATRAPVQRLADRVSAVFVPVVLAIAALTVIGWSFAGRPLDGVLYAVTTLVISCPCALGIATPMAVMVGVGEAGRRGILVKDAATIERASRARSVVFDKTGTLTAGKPDVTAIRPSGGSTGANELLAIAASAERGSEHPIGRAIVRRAEAERLAIAPATSFRAIAGTGVEATVEGRLVRVERDAEASCRVLVDGTLVGHIDVADAVRPTSAAAVASLRHLGLELRLLTGDRRSRALDVAGAVGLRETEVLADATPESKAAALDALPAPRVMVGDGINDAAALARADVGIAMGEGSALAIETAPIVLLRGDPRGVPAILDVAAQTFRAVRQNLFLAFVYNAMAIPAAAFGLLGTRGPLVAAAAMALSDLCVVGNALRLKARLARERARTESMR